MTNFEDLALINLDTAQAIVNDNERFEYLAAELLVRNAKMITKHLDAEEFFDLPFVAERAAIRAAEAANNIAPLNSEELMPSPQEDSLNFHYRTGIWQPLQSFDKKLILCDFNKDNPEEVARMKSAVQLGSMAFSAILLTLEYHPVVRDWVRFYWINTNDAAERVAQSQRD